MKALKSIDVALTGTEITAGTINAGGDVVLVGMSLPVNVLFVAIRADVPQPNKDKGYPGNMVDLKGMKVGVPARGAGAEFYMNALLKEAGLQPTDVTYVAVGGPATAYTSMVTGKLVPGTKARFFLPMIPGPESNKAKASLYEHTYNGLYSSELMMYLNWMVSPKGTTSNSRAIASNSELKGMPVAFARSISPGKLRLALAVLVEAAKLPLPSIPYCNAEKFDLALPFVITIPLSIPIFVPPWL